MFRHLLDDLIAVCKEAASNGHSLDEILSVIVPQNSRVILQSSKAFFQWVQQERELAFFYYEALSQGVCAKPAEVAATILELIIREQLEREES